jgi:hypothetical protein
VPECVQAGFAGWKSHLHEDRTKAKLHDVDSLARQLVGPASNPSLVFSGSGSGNSTEIDGNILVAAYFLTSAIPGGGGGGGSTPSITFLGSVTEVDEVEGTDVFLGTVSVVSVAPSGAAVPYLGKVRL